MVRKTAAVIVHLRHRLETLVVRTMIEMRLRARRGGVGERAALSPAIAKEPPAHVLAVCLLDHLRMIVDSHLPTVSLGCA